MITHNLECDCCPRVEKISHVYMPKKWMRVTIHRGKQERVMVLCNDCAKKHDENVKEADRQKTMWAVLSLFSRDL